MSALTVATVIDYQLKCIVVGVPPMMQKEETGEIGTVIRVETTPRRGVVMYDVSGHHKHLGLFVPEADLGKWSFCSVNRPLPFRDVARAKNGVTEGR